jgi:hypothetical protein
MSTRLCVTTFPGYLELHLTQHFCVRAQPHFAAARQQLLTSRDFLLYQTLLSFAHRPFHLHPHAHSHAGSVTLQAGYSHALDWHHQQATQGLSDLTCFHPLQHHSDYATKNLARHYHHHCECSVRSTLEPSLANSYNKRSSQPQLPTIFHPILPILALPSLPQGRRQNSDLKRSTYNATAVKRHPRRRQTIARQQAAA